MKNFILAVAFVMLMVSTSFAADLFTVNSLNLAGDTVYLTASGNFAVGAGSNIASIKDIVEIRAEIVTPINSDGDTKAGIGAGINVVKIIKKLNGTWLVGNINPSIGVMGLTNLNGVVKLEPAIYVSIINIVL